MAEKDDLGLRVSITAKTDGASFDEATAEVKGFAEGAKRDLASVGGAAKDAGKKVGEGLAAPAAVMDATSRRLAEINKAILDIAEDGSPRGIKQLAKLKVEMDELRASGKLTEDQLQEVSQAEANIGKATESITKQKKAMFELTDEVSDNVAQTKLSNELWDDSRGKMGALTNAVTMVAGSFTGGFAIGVGLAKKAGVDFTESIAVGNQALTAIGKGADWLVGGPIRALTGAIDDSAESMKALAGMTTNAEVQIVSFFDALENVKKRNQGYMGLIRPEDIRIEQKALQDQRNAVYASAKAEVLRLEAVLEHYRKLRDAKKIDDTIYLATLEKLERQRATLAKLAQNQAAEEGKLLDVQKQASEVREKLAEQAQQAAAKEKQHQEELKRLAEERVKKIDEAAKRRLEDAELAQNTTETMIGLIRKELDHWTGSEETKRELIQKRIGLERKLAAEKEDAAKKILATDVRMARLQIAKFGPNGETITAYREARQKEIEATAESCDAKLAAEMQLADEVADLQMKQLKLSRKSTNAEVMDFQEAVATMLADTQLSAEQRVAIEQWASDQINAMKTAEVGWAAMTAEQKSDYAVQGISTALGAAKGAFGETKEIAVAETLVQTYQSAVAAFKSLALIPYVGPVLGAIAAAAAIASGMKQIQAIESTEPGAGSGAGAGAGTPSFDDPVNDAAARFAGQQSARDLANQFRIGHNLGMSQELATGTAFQRSGATTMATGGARGGRSGKIELHIHGHVSTPPREYVKAFTRAQRSQSKTVEKKTLGNRGYAVG